MAHTGARQLGQYDVAQMIERGRVPIKTAHLDGDAFEQSKRFVRRIDQTLQIFRWIRDAGGREMIGDSPLQHRGSVSAEVHAGTVAHDVEHRHDEVVFDSREIAAQHAAPEGNSKRQLAYSVGVSHVLDRHRRSRGVSCSPHPRFRFRMDVLDSFHPAVAAWFRRAFEAPTPAQVDAWPAIQAGRHVLIAAPTGSGKTFAAFLAAIDGLVRDGLAGTLPDETRIVYVSPLKALSNDINRNLAAPLAGIREELSALGLADVAIRTFVRTGDTPQAERARMAKTPPHIVVTTPESLYILLGSESGRKMLGTTRTVIVDEIHAIAGSKRGAHLALSLERLDALAARPLTRVGLSATQKPPSWWRSS